MGGTNTWTVLLAAICLSACTVSDDSDNAADPGSEYAGENPLDGSDDTEGSGDGSGSDTEGGDEGEDGEDMGDEMTPGEGSGSGGAMGGGGASNPPQGTMLKTGCNAYNSGVYTPFPGYGPVSVGTPGTHPWRGPSTYPDGLEDFRQYTTPSTVECGSNKGARDHVDVTAGCLSALSSSGDKRGQIQLTNDGYYRSFALPHDAQYGRRVAWADQGVEYKFFYSAWTGTEGNPGFKAFVRYLTEYDLYVASWRRDGVVQIQKKQCGSYTTLKRIANFGAPSLNTWHTIKFQIVGNQMQLWLDGQLVITVSDSSITHGTAGIRIDSANGSLIDDWRTYAP